MSRRAQKKAVRTSRMLRAILNDKPSKITTRERARLRRRGDTSALALKSEPERSDRKNEVS